MARRAERLEKLAAEFGGADAVLAVPLDLTAPGAGERLWQELERRGVLVDLLVNNAGVGHTGPFLQEPPARIEAMIDLNVRALVDLTRRFTPAMVARGGGAVINVASTSAFQPVPYLAVYGASKVFVLSFTEALATELRGTGVVVQALCPGRTESEFHQTAGTDKVLFTRYGNHERGGRGRPLAARARQRPPARDHGLAEPARGGDAALHAARARARGGRPAVPAPARICLSRRHLRGRTRLGASRPALRLLSCADHIHPGPLAERP